MGFFQDVVGSCAHHNCSLNELCVGVIGTTRSVCKIAGYIFSHHSRMCYRFISIVMILYNNSNAIFDKVYNDSL